VLPLFFQLSSSSAWGVPRAVRHPFLTRQPTLGASLTEAALQVAEPRRSAGASSPHLSLGAWRPLASASSRGALRSAEALPRNEPAAQAISVWIAHVIGDSDPSGDPSCQRIACVGRLFGYGDPPRDGPLAPVYVLHDRSPHAERQA
ncbi:unnamed protein product, partial [Polarella glacialis]